MYKKLIYVTIIIGVVLLSGYFIARTIIRNKIAAALQKLPPSIHLSYGSLDYSLLKGNLDCKDIHLTFIPDTTITTGNAHPPDTTITRANAHALGTTINTADAHSPDATHYHELRISHLTITNLGLISYLRNHELHIKQILIRGCTAHLDQYLLDHQPKNITTSFPKTAVTAVTAVAAITANTAVTAIGQLVIQDLDITTQHSSLQQASLTLDTIHLNTSNNINIQHINLHANNIVHTIPNTYEKIHITGMTFDSRAASHLHIDTARITPTINKIEIGRKLGQQTDCVTAKSENIDIEELNLQALLQAHTLQATTIRIAHNHIEVYRDRRLPRDTVRRLLPSAFLRSLPLTLRIGQLTIGRSSFTYEEQPAKGSLTGALKVTNMKVTIHPLINHPNKDDPRYCTMKMEGSLMGSGTVTATTKLPLHEQDPYLIEGAFHNLDVTTLNPSAENLGLIHLESGILNELAFKFSMTDERSTGSIIGEYHNLVVQKLKGSNDDKKVDKVKSFFLRHLIIPKDKDHTLAVAKRTGKVDYKHDPTRNFSYYMLHSLLVGVKSSFKLGFLLPG